MFIEVIGGSKSQKNHVEKMVAFCAKKLMPKMNLDITVNLCKPTDDFPEVTSNCKERTNRRFPQFYEQRRRKRKKQAARDPDRSMSEN